MSDKGVDERVSERSLEFHTLRSEGEELRGLVQSAGRHLLTLQIEEYLAPAAGGHLVYPAVEQVPGWLIHQTLLWWPGKPLLSFSVL